MTELDYDKELIVLEKRLEENIAEFDSVSDEVSELNSYLSNLECEHDIIIKEIDKLKKELLDIELTKLDNSLTGDEFRDAFVKCSFFCEKYCTYNKTRQYVKITKDYLLAADGYRALKIKCNIPDELKNTSIKWNVRDNFEDNIEHNISTGLVYANINKLFTEDEDVDVINCNLAELKDKYLIETRDGSPGILVFEYKNNKIGFNKEYYNILSMVFKGTETRIYYPHDIHMPLLVKSKKQSAVLLPIILPS